MGFKYRTFDQPTYPQRMQEPERVIIISCEGRVTEPEYFGAIKRKLNEYIPALLEVDVVPKEDNNSSPQDVLNNLERHILDKYDYNRDYDQMWIVCDREKKEHRKAHLIDIIPICEEKNYSLAVTNPTFEFWLLLHAVDIESYDKQQLFDNQWVTEKKKRRYIDKELSEVLANGFNKKTGKFNTELVTIENIKRALEQEKYFANKRDDILDQLGSNVGDLIRVILPDV
ncbi:MAG: hypothetical protein ACI8WB_004788 [Phenylobacterium sp.]|jgi:hypothetical protein